MKSTHFLNGWCLGMRNGSYTTILCESDHGQSALRQLKRWQTRTNGQEGSTVHLVELERNHLLEMLPHGQTLNSDLYSQQLDRLKPVTDQK
ncbi:hypothetical protein TNCV_746701 [Trichonephila clavipes]|nr:hypothetical protein TNCV_746701 [Trichonephila clavipes]